jgi:cell division GTPase FtsZ
MRIFAIGIGGAGCRIADMLYRSDKKYSAVSCVEAIAIDRDITELNGLPGIPLKKKVYFPDVPVNAEDISADITTDEILSLLHEIDPGNMDAVIICTGAGGTMTNVACSLIPKMKATMMEPVFGLVTLPRVEEGKRVSAKAALDIERLTPLLDGIILFDNDTWWKKKEPASVPATRKARSPVKLQGNRTNQSIPVSGEYRHLNAGITRRVGLLLRAGEFSEKGDIETGEVVLDAGEILNTIQGMGFIAIGYAAADLSVKKSLLPRILHSRDHHAESGHAKASRLVDLAKDAMYENISIPCDMTSAEKALILVAGPSHEISMKGFMNVRRWIDRSISGMELRSGDYPVKTTHHLAVILILAGLKNIPRLREIRSVLDDYSKENPGWEREIREISPGSSLLRENHLKALADTDQGVVKTTSAASGVAGRIRDIMPGLPPQERKGTPAPSDRQEAGMSVPFFRRRGESSRAAGTGRTPVDTYVSSTKVPDRTITEPRQPLHPPGKPGPESSGRERSGQGTNRVTAVTDQGSGLSGEPGAVVVQNGKPDTEPVKGENMEKGLSSIVAKAREDLARDKRGQ